MIEVQYLDVAPEIEKKMTIRTDGATHRTDPALLTKLGTDPAVASFELFGWPLDGSRKLLGRGEKTPVWSDTMGGVWSGCLGVGALQFMSLGSENTDLLYPTTVTVEINEVCTVPMITLVFAPEEGHWCSKVAINLYREETVVLERMEYPDAPYWTVPVAGVEFDQVEILLIATDTPGRMCKLSRLYLGQVLAFSHGELESVRLVNEADPTLDALTVDTMTVELRDLQKRGLSPRENQRMELYRDGKLLASHRIESCTRQEKHRYTFRCRSLVGQLEDTFYGGMYDGVSLETVLAQILQGIEYQIDTPLRNTEITGYLPVCTRREALQQVAFAVGAMVSTQGVRGIRLCCVPGYVSSHLLPGSVFQGGEVETAPGVSCVEVVAHQYAPLQEREILMENEYMDGDDISVFFDAPHHSYEIQGGRVVGYGVNYVRLRASGNVTLTACPYRHTTVRHSRNFSPTEGVSRDQVRKVEEATLIHSGNVRELLDRLGEIYALQQTLTQTVVVDGQIAGEQVAMSDPFGDVLKGYITAMESELTPGGQTARITLLGQHVSPELSLEYAGMLYAGEEVSLCP